MKGNTREVVCYLGTSKLYLYILWSASHTFLTFQPHSPLKSHETFPIHYLMVWGMCTSSGGDPNDLHVYQDGECGSPAAAVSARRRWALAAPPHQQQLDDSFHGLAKYKIRKSERQQIVEIPSQRRRNIIKIRFWYLAGNPFRDTCNIFAACHQFAREYTTTLKRQKNLICQKN